MHVFVEKDALEATVFAMRVGGKFPNSCCKFYVDIGPVVYGGEGLSMREVLAPSVGVYVGLDIVYERETLI